MTLEAVVGVNWGDEGKGRMVDYLASAADVVVRYQGGNNAGHTVVNDHGTFKLNLVPSGIFNPSAINVLGPGMVIDIESLHSEMAKLNAVGIGTDSLLVSDRATVCFPFHREEDALEEVRLADELFGSTKRGIAPAYGDRYIKKAILIGELNNKDWLARRLKPIVEWKSMVLHALYGAPPVELSDVIDWAVTYGEHIKPYVTDVSVPLSAAVDAGKHIIFEAQLGALRDIYFGIYPYTSSSCALANFACIGAGIPGRSLDRVIGVMKAFSTCIGEGPFVTEMHGDVASELRETAEEYGAATGRPRRIGHFDAVASRYGVEAQGATELALTKLDSLSGLPELKICTEYRIGDTLTDRFPVGEALGIAEPVYETFEGWSENIQDVRLFEDLPAAAIRYVLAIERLVGCYVQYVSVGPERSQLIDRGRHR